MKQDGVAAPRGLIPTFYDQKTVEVLFVMAHLGRISSTTALKLFMCFPELYLGQLRDLGFGADPVLSLFFLLVFPLGLCISCQTVLCLVCSLEVFNVLVGWTNTFSS